MTLHRIGWAAALLAVSLGSAAQGLPRQTYIVQLADAPVAAYSGGIPGYAATQPAAGRRLDVNATAVAAYVGYLDAQRGNALAVVGPSNLIYDYKIAFNGFAASLTAAQVRTLQSMAGVKTIVPDQARPMDTTRTPTFLGLTAPRGLWSHLDANGRQVKGEDVIIGALDGGVWPENPSFSDKVDASGTPIASHLPGTRVYDPLPAGRYKGSCQAGQGFTAAMCNNKLVGAQFFNAGFLASKTVLWQGEYVSPRDEDGHGDHTLSTAGGNAGVPASVNGSPVGLISGIAPRARVAAYKICWTDIRADGSRDQPGCYLSDSVAAINKAVADGVDVINFSISGSLTSFLDPVEVAFFNAAGAGVFIAASAGNSGPANTVAHISPWLTTVAASTHDRFTQATVTLGSGERFSGPSYQTAGLPSSPLILSDNAGVQPYASLSTANQLALRRCYSEADRSDPTLNTGVTLDSMLDPAKVAGKIVVCIRGGGSLVNKGAAVKTAGGAGMILQNAAGTSNTLPAQTQAVPTVHLDAAAAPTVLAYAATAGATASFSGAVQVPGVIAPVMADFSSRGPNMADPNVLKPDITGPGVDIIAAYTNTSLADRDAIIAGTLIPGPGANAIQGTSMSSPHVAGAAALLKQLHPTWSPAAIKSALMTSAGPVKLASGAIDTNRWGYGAGHLNPNGAADTTLVYDARRADYLAYANGDIAPYNLNLPSMTVAALVGKGTVTRTVTNGGTSQATYVASASLPGYEVSVVPASLSLAPGQSASFDINLTLTSATIGAWSFGSLTWSNGTSQVTSPLSARGTLLSAVRLVEDTRNVGTKVFTVGTGFTGTLVTTPSGLLPATRSEGIATLNESTCFPFTVPAGTLAARFQLFDSDTVGGSANDLDLEVYRGGVLVGSSGGATSDELVDLPAPPAAEYRACVVGFAPVGGRTAFTLSSWLVGPAAGPQTLRAAGASRAYLGGTASVGLSWSVPANARYLGVVQYRNGAAGAVLGSTLVSVDAVPTPAAAVVAPAALRDKTAAR